ncbi:hypothetical protein [Yersinia aleksiciae]|uniref:hypothetical protein n=1 Tax=Yersinia aleksiciae TaxID=263819 RepID=UPI0011AAD315|nr:hypothetical protein [Yersinia aleksiciae]
MQVRTSGINPGISAGVATPQRVGVDKTRETKPLRRQTVKTAFPESGYLSVEPLRYNVQLNEQLTSLQQADHYLLEIESQLSALQQTVSQGHKAVKQQSQQLLSWLEQREVASGGTVDRQLKISLESQPKVNFTINGINKVLQTSARETLLFSLTDEANSVVAFKLSAQSTSKQKLLELNKILGRLGIHGQLDANNQVVFQTDEHRWVRINQHLAVRGEGLHYPAGQFQRVELQAERVLEDKIRDIVGQPFVVREYAKEVQQTLSLITEQLRQLNKLKENARERVAGIAGVIQPDTAITIAKRLSQKQLSERTFYIIESQGVRGQGFLHHSTVRNLFIS